jgi:hypothetical protein
MSLWISDSNISPPKYTKLHHVSFEYSTVKKFLQWSRKMHLNMYDYADNAWEDVFWRVCKACAEKAWNALSLLRPRNFTVRMGSAKILRLVASEILIAGSVCHLVSRWFLARLILRSRRWRLYVPPECRLTFNGQGIISQETYSSSRDLLNERTLCLQFYIIKLVSGYKRFRHFEEGQQRLEDDLRKVNPQEAHNEDTTSVPDIPTGLYERLEKPQKCGYLP